MNARATSLAGEFADLRLPGAQRATSRKGGGPGTREPRGTGACRPAGIAVVRALHASTRSRRRLTRNRIAADSQLTVCA